MITTGTEFKWDEFRRKIRDWWSKRRNAQLLRANSVYERSISILQKRYGYDRAKAITELNKHYLKAQLG